MSIPCPTTYYTRNNSRRQHSRLPNYFRDYTDRIYTRSILNAYKNRDSDEYSKWELILSRAPSNVDRYYQLRYLKKVFSMWINEIGKGKTVAMLNYKDFHNLLDMPNYLDVRRSSAGIRGWTKAGPWHHHNPAATI